MNLIHELECEKAHADSMAGMAQFWMRRAQEAERLAMLLVHAAGGKIVVHGLDLLDAPNLTLTREYHADDMTHRFSTQGTSHE